MEALLTNLGLIVTAILGWIPDVATMVVETPIMLLGFGLMFCGACFGFLRRGTNMR